MTSSEVETKIEVTEQELDFRELLQEEQKELAFRDYELKGYVPKGHNGLRRGRKSGGKNAGRIRARIEDVIMRSFLGEKGVDIAFATGYTISSVSLILKKPYAQSILRDLHKNTENKAIDVHDQLLDQLIENIKLPGELMSDKGTDNNGRFLVPPSVKLKAFMDVADRTGFQVIKKIDINSSKPINAQSLREIKSRSDVEVVEEAEIVENA